MRFSIITVCFNSEEFIASAVQSVLSQDFLEYEYLIVDGGSTDRTVEILREWEPLFNGRMKIISEPDRGIYDAMNKGIFRAQGEIIGLLNSDDCFYGPCVLSRYNEWFSAHNCDVIFADLVYVARDQINQIKRDWRSSKFPAMGMHLGWMPAHPTFYVKRAVYEKFGLYKQKYRISADYELMLRFLQKEKVTCMYMPKRVVRMRLGGNSNGSFSIVLKSNIECWLAAVENGYLYNPLMIIMKPIRKISQFILAKSNSETNSN